MLGLAPSRVLQKWGLSRRHQAKSDLLESVVALILSLSGDLSFRVRQVKCKGINCFSNVVVALMHAFRQPQDRHPVRHEEMFANKRRHFLVTTSITTVVNPHHRLYDSAAARQVYHRLQVSCVHRPFPWIHDEASSSARL